MPKQETKEEIKVKELSKLIKETAVNDGEIYYNASSNNWVGCSNKVLKIIKNGN
jgi:hypothetical protein